jgi:hypothetical protein
MKDARDIEKLKDLGVGKSAPSEIVRLYHRAFAEFGTRALWNWREMERPTITQALAIADSLRTEGNKQARALAVQIEEACRAAL